MQSFISALRNQRAFKALHYREFRLITGCQMFGNLGTWMDELSRGWLIYQLTDSVVQLGLVRGIQFIPTLFFSPIAGSAADRYSRKTLLLVSQAINALLFAALALLIFTQHVAAVARVRDRGAAGDDAGDPAACTLRDRDRHRAARIADQRYRPYRADLQRRRGSSGRRWPARSSPWWTPAARSAVQAACMFLAVVWRRGNGPPLRFPDGP